jgi:hypothetical protein
MNAAFGVRFFVADFFAAGRFAADFLAAPFFGADFLEDLLADFLAAGRLVAFAAERRAGAFLPFFAPPRLADFFIAAISNLRKWN